MLPHMDSAHNGLTLDVAKCIVWSRDRVYIRDQNLKRAYERHDHFTSPIHNAPEATAM